MQYPDHIRKQAKELAASAFVDVFGAADKIAEALSAAHVWQTMESAPRDGTEILLHYKSFCGHKDLVVSGHWDDTQGPDNATWEHSLGSGDADHWMPLPKPPNPFHPSP